MSAQAAVVALTAKAIADTRKRVAALELADQQRLAQRGERGPQGLPGPRGIPGQNGTDGAPGVDGKDGADGIGERGKDGRDGTGITAARIDRAGDLWITYTDGRSNNIGRVRGEDGKDGKDGIGRAVMLGGGGGGITEARVIELIEELMASDSGEQEYPHQTATVTASGDTVVLTPAAGKALRLHWFYAVCDPDSSNSPLIKVTLGTREIYRAYAIAKRQLINGAADEVLTVNLSSAASVAVTVIYEEVAP